MNTIEVKVISGSDVGKTFRIIDQTVVFGRTQAADLVLDQDRLLSSRHFEITAKEGAFTLKDLGSTNGTRVNGHPVTSCELASGDQIAVGTTLLLVQFPDSAPVANDAGSESITFDPFDSYYAGAAQPQPAKKGDTVTAGKMSAESSGDATVTQVRLRIVSEVEEGNLSWLAPGQSLTFGRTAKSDRSFGFDAHLSSQHFRIICQTDQCLVEDLESKSGTWLNGKKIRQSAIYDGDRLVAGKTEFTIELEGATGVIRRSDSGVASPAALPETIQPLTVEATQSTTAGGLARLQGTLPAPESAVGIVESWSRLGLTFGVVDFSRLGMEIPADVAEETGRLFHWLPVEAARQMPLLLSFEELATWPQVVEEGWGSDALLILHSTLKHAELLERLRELLVAQGSEDSSQGILGYCWPSVLEPLLLQNPHGFADEFFDIVRLVLLEGSEANQWQVFGSDEAVAACSGLGWTIAREPELEEVD